MSDEAAAPRKRAGYGVKLVRGPFVRLSPHPDSCATEEQFLRYAAACHRRGERLAAGILTCRYVG